MDIQNRSMNVAVQARPLQVNERHVYVDSCLRVEHKRYFVAIKGRPLKLTKTEFRLISYLASHMSDIATFDDLWRFAWEIDKAINRKSIHVYVSRIRRKLAPFGLR